MANHPNKSTEGRKVKSDTWKAIKTISLEKSNREIEMHLNTLTVQNNILGVFPLERESRRWQRLLTGMTPGQLAFVLKAATSTLLAPMTLRRMAFQVETSCPLCNSTRCTAKHILNSCREALNRYKWRHDTALSIIVAFLKEQCRSLKCSIYADLNNFRASENPPATIPIEVLATRSIPDIVIVDETNPHKKKITMLETKPHFREMAIIGLLPNIPYIFV